MAFTVYNSAKAMMEKTRHFFLKNEAKHNLPLGLLRQLAKEEEQGLHFPKEVFMAAEENEDEVEAVVLMTPSQNGIICGKNEGVKKAAEWFLDNNIRLPGITGCTETAEVFADLWTQLNGCRKETVRSQNIYRLDRVKQSTKNRGRLSYATEDDIALVMAWSEEYEDLLGAFRYCDLEETARREIRNNQVYFWRDEQCTPVSMAKKGRELINGAVINYVFTPEEYQRQGYATTCVTAISERLLNEGYKFCSLNTNAENRSSNSIYMKIGYEPAGEAVEIRFYYN